MSTEDTMSPTERDRLAALLHESGNNCQWGDPPHAYAEAELLCDGPSPHLPEADRLLAAGVRLTPAPPPDALRRALEAVVDAGPPPDALMDGSPAGQALRSWWLERYAPALAAARAALATPAEPPPAAPPTLDALDLPERVVVGANGAYWRDYGTHYSMCPVSTDNDPIEPIAVYHRSPTSEETR